MKKALLALALAAVAATATAAQVDQFIVPANSKMTVSGYASCVSQSPEAWQSGWAGTFNWTLSNLMPWPMVWQCERVRGVSQ